MREDDASYCRRRAIQEQVAAQNSACKPARERHDEMAAMYRFRATMLSKGPEYWAKAFDEGLLPEAA